MKTILAVIALAVCSLVAQAQTTTNLIFRVQEQHVNGAVSNIVDTANYTWTYTVKKEGLKIDGFRHGALGSPLTFVLWIKQDINDRAKAYADAKQAVDNAALLAKLQSLLGPNVDLLTAQDLSDLNTIANKAP